MILQIQKWRIKADVFYVIPLGCLKTITEIFIMIQHWLSNTKMAYQDLMVFM